MQNWTVDDVISLLQELELEEHAPLFRRRKVDGLLLPKLTDEDLETELEITDRLDRKRLLAHIERRQSPSTGQVQSMPRAYSQYSEEAYVLEVQPPHKYIKETILRDLPKGTNILREALQNGDDARASSMKFVLDRTKYPKGSLWDTRLEAYQDAALVLKSNSEFRDQDFSDFKKLHATNKDFAPDKIGRFGLGSRSYFHLADILFVYSSGQLLIVDPSHRVFPSGGIKFGSVSQLRKDYPDQLAPFDPYLDEHDPCTIFRLPLRSESMAATSTFSPDPYSESDAEVLLGQFAADAGHMLLFLNSVTSIQGERRDRDVTELLFSIDLQAPAEARRPLLDFLRRAATFEDLRKHCERGEGPPLADYEALVRVVSNFSPPRQEQSFRWRVLQRLLGGERQELAEAMAANIPRLHRKPHVGIALPVGQDARLDGHAFCYFPLASRTRLPVHVHADFVVTRNRREIQRDGEDPQDLEGDSRDEYEWNRHLRSALACLYAEALSSPTGVQGPGHSSPEATADGPEGTAAEAAEAHSYNCWPKEQAAGPWLEMQEELLELLCERPCLWSPSPGDPNRRLVAPSEAKVLPKELGDLEELAARVAARGGASIVVLPESVASICAARLQHVTLVELCSDKYLPPETWRTATSEEADQLMLYLLTQCVDAGPNDLRNVAKRWLPGLDRGFPVGGQGNDGRRDRLTSLFEPTEDLWQLAAGELHFLGSRFAGKAELLPLLRELGLKVKLDLAAAKQVARSIADGRDPSRADLLARQFDHLDVDHENCAELVKEVEWIPTIDDVWCAACDTIFDVDARGLEGYGAGISVLRQLGPICGLGPRAQEVLLDKLQAMGEPLKLLDARQCCTLLKAGCKGLLDTPVPVSEAPVEFLRQPQDVLSLLAFLQRLPEYETELLEGMPLCLLSDGHLTCFGGSRSFYESRFSDLLPLLADSFLAPDVEAVVEAPCDLLGWKQFDVDTVVNNLEGFLNPQELQKLTETDYVFSTPQLQKWLVRFLNFLFPNGDSEHVPEVPETVRKVPLIPSEGKAGKVILARRRGAVVVNLDRWPGERRDVLTSALVKLGWYVLAEFPDTDIQPRVREALCTDTAGLLEQVQLLKPEEVQLLEPSEKNAFRGWLLDQPSVVVKNVHVLALPIWDLDGQQMAASSLIFVSDRKVYELLKDFDGVHLAEGSDFQVLQRAGKEVETPLSAVRAVSSRIAESNMPPEWWARLLKLAVDEFSDDELRDFARINLLPGGCPLHEFFDRTDHLVAALIVFMRPSHLLPVEVGSSLLERLAPYLRPVKTAEDLALLLSQTCLADEGRGGLGEDAKVKSSQALLQKLKALDGGEVAKLASSGFRDEDVLYLEGRWHRPRKVFVGRLRRLVDLTDKGPTLKDIPETAEELFAEELDLPVEFAAEQLVLLCERGEAGRLHEVYEFLDRRMREPEPRLGQALERLRAMRCLLMDDGLLQYPHLVVRELSVECPPFVRAPSCFDGFGAGPGSFLHALGVQERAAEEHSQLPERRTFEDRCRQLFADQAWCDLKMVTKDGTVSGHRSVLFQEASLMAARQAHYQEDGQQGCFVLDVPEATKLEVAFLKRYIYLGEVGAVTLEAAPGLLEAAKLFGVRYLTAYLDRWLRSAPGPEAFVVV